VFSKPVVKQARSATRQNMEKTLERLEQLLASEAAQSQ
jgi:hypothetical protein